MEEKKWTLEAMNEHLALLYKIRQGHSDKNGVCAECGQPFPCVTIQSMTTPGGIMSENSKGAEFKAKQDKKKARRNN